MTSNNNPSPRSGDDTFDLIDQALAALAEQRQAWLGDPLTTIALLQSLINQAERCVPTQVFDARENGLSWTEIAHALDTSPEEASLRFDPDSPIAHPRWPYDY